MRRTGCADIRDGDLFHGRYRIFRSIDNDRTGALYEAVDMVNNTHRLVKVIQAETLSGAGIRVRFRSDAPLWDSANVVYVSDAGLDHDTKSFFLILDLAEDSELEPVTKQHVICMGESGPSETAAVRSPSDLPLAMQPAPAQSRLLHDGHDAALPEWRNSDGPPPQRPSIPLPLPPPLLPSASRTSQLPVPPPPLLVPAGRSSVDSIHSVGIRPLPPPTPPPERPLPEPTPSSRKRMFRSTHFFALVAVAIGVGSIVYFRPGQAISEDLPERADTSMEHSPAHLTPLSQALVTPNAAPVAVASVAQEVPDASVSANWIPGETISTKSAKSAPDAALHEAPPNTSQHQSPTHEISKPGAVLPKAAPITPVSTKRQRESIF